MAEISGLPLFSDANLQAYWKGENVNDSKNSNTLTNHNSVAFNAGKYGNGFDFGAANTNKYLDVASNLSIAGNGDGSISFWVKLSAEISSGLSILAQHASTTGADRYFQIYYDYNGGTRRLVADFSGGGAAVNYNIALGTVVYHHIVITRNVAGNSGELFVNNVSRGTTTLGSGTFGVNRVSIGGDTGSNLLSGIIDDVGIFNKKISVAEVGQIYNGVSSGFISVSY